MPIHLQKLLDGKKTIKILTLVGRRVLNFFCELVDFCKLGDDDTYMKKVLYIK